MKLVTFRSDSPDFCHDSIGIARLTLLYLPMNAM